MKPRSRTTHRASGLAQGGVHAMGFTGGFLFRVHQKIIVFEIHVKSTNDGEQVSLKITWIYNDFYNDLTGIGSPQFFFSEKSAPQNHRRFWTESQWPGKWRNCTATRLLRRRRQSPRRCLFLNGWGAQKRHTVARLKTSSG